ncbi:MAG: hypothetical protein KIT58_12905 [Planctomycetota bacterium]|nr:hypothetical protein [Planctomycetota bacterium]
MTHQPREPHCPVGPAGRAWLEARVGWILGAFGSDRARRLHVALPAELLDERVDGSPDGAFAIFERVRAAMGLDLHPLRFELYSEEIDGLPDWARDGERSGTAGHFIPAAPGAPQLVRLERSQLQDPAGLVATLAHELCHVLLIGQERITGDEADHEPLTDLLCVFSGFGVFAANGVIRERNTATRWSVGRLGYLRQEEFAYALALLARLREEERPAWADALCRDVRSWFDESLAYLAVRDWGPAQAEAARREATGLDALDFAALWAGAADEEPPTRARIPSALVLFVLAPLLLCIGSMIVPPILEARGRALHVVNATPWPATVEVGKRTTTVGPGRRERLEVGEGRHTIVVTSPGGEERLEAVMQTTWGERTSDRRTVFVLNVLGAAALHEHEVAYGRTRSTAPPPAPKIRWGETFLAVPHVHDAFKTPPDSVAARKGSIPLRRWLDWPGEGAAAADMIAAVADHDRGAAAGLLALHRRLCPEDPDLAALAAGWARGGGERR